MQAMQQWQKYQHTQTKLTEQPFVYNITLYPKVVPL